MPWCPCCTPWVASPASLRPTPLQAWKMRGEQQVTPQAPVLPLGVMLSPAVEHPIFHTHAPSSKGSLISSKLRLGIPWKLYLTHATCTKACALASVTVTEQTDAWKEKHWHLSSEAVNCNGVRASCAPHQSGSASIVCSSAEWAPAL